MGIIDTDSAEHYKWGNNSDGWHLLKTDSLSVIQERVSPGESECRHYHCESQQLFYVLAGTASIELCGVIHEIQAGSGIHVAPKQSHQLSNQASIDLLFLVISQPMSHGDRVNT